MIVPPLVEFRQIFLIAIGRVHGQAERGDGKFQFLAILVRGYGDSIFRHLQLYGAASGGHDAFGKVAEDLGILIFAGDDVLDAFELLEGAVVPMLILDRPHDQGMNLLGTGRGISGNGCALAAGHRPRAWRADPRRQGGEAHCQRHEMSFANHAFPWRCWL